MEVSPPIFNQATEFLHFPAHRGRAVMEATLWAATEMEQGCALPAGMTDFQALHDGMCCDTNLPWTEVQENENAKGTSHGWTHACCWPPQGTGGHQGLWLATPSWLLRDHGYARAEVCPSCRQAPHQSCAEQPVSVAAMGAFPVPVNLRSPSFWVSLVNPQLSGEIIFLIYQEAPCAFPEGNSVLLN